MAFAAAVMSTAGGHRVFNNGNTSPTASTSTSVAPPPPRQLGASIIPIRSHSNSSNIRTRTVSNNSGAGIVTPSTSSRSISKMATSPGLDTNYIANCNTSLSSFKPRLLSPTTSPIMKNTTSLPDSPQMIRCSTCNCLVSLFDLSDHICKPVASPATSTSTNTAGSTSSSSNISLAQLRQPGSNVHAHSRLGSGFTHHVQSSAQANVTTNHRPLLNPLRVNVSHAAQRGAQYEAPLPTAYRTPLPRSPSDHSPSNNSTNYPISTGSSSAGGLPSSSSFNNLSPSHAYEQYPSSSSSASSSPYTTSYSDHNTSHSSQQSPYTPSYSPPASIPSSASLHAENNAGIGARMPFYEKLQQQRGLSYSPTSPVAYLPGQPQPSPPISARSAEYQSQQHLPHQAARPFQDANRRDISQQQQQRLAPKSPISPGWSGLGNEPSEIFNYFNGGDEQKTRDSLHDPHKDQEEQEYNERGSNEAAKQGSNDLSGSRNRAPQSQHNAHVRETSDSGQSSANSQSYNSTLDYFINKDGSSSPETSPEFADTPVFRFGQQHAASASTEDSQSVKRNHDEEPEEEHDDDEHDYTDDIIDSYPTPQANFSGRFGGLVIDDDYQEPYGSTSAPSILPSTVPPPASASHSATAKPLARRDQLQVSTAFTAESAPLSAPLIRAHSDRQFQQALRTAPAMASFGRGLQVSHSTPNNLSQLAGNGARENERPARGNTDRKEDESLIPFGQRRRLLSDTSGPPATAAAEAELPGEISGLRLDACLDDLLKEMNRESIDTVSGAAAASSSTLSTASGQQASKSRCRLSFSKSDTSTTPTSPGATFSARPFDNLPPTSPLQSHKLKKQNLATMPIDTRCGSCNQVTRSTQSVERDGQSFCSECYAHLYLPKCRKCRLPIEDKAIGSGDGKVKGKFHVGCFSCFSCSAPFPTGDFYVYASRPYCAQHYHERNGTLCANPSCSEELRGIEGPCVSLVGEENGNGGRYHPCCFQCSDAACEIVLDQYHYVLAGLPYCERHAQEMEDRDASSYSNSNTSRSVSPPSSAVDHDAFYDVAYGSSNVLSASQGSSNASTPLEQRRRSASLDVPAQSLNQLRKNAQAPNYRGMLARRRSNGRRPSETSWALPAGQTQNGNNHVRQASRQAGPPPVTRTRRAEKRRTVISQFPLH